MISLKLAVVAVLALAGAGCATTNASPRSAEKLSPWQDPVWLAEQAQKKKNGEAIQAELSKCHTSKARLLAYSNMPAISVVVTAHSLCKDIENRWVDSQIGPGITREMAQQVIEDAINGDSLQILRAYVIDLRAMHDKAPAPAPTPKPNNLQM